MSQRGLISSLFDLSFTHFITPKIQRFLYALLLFGSALGGLAVLVMAFGMGSGFFAKVGALLVGIPAAAITFLFLAMYFRVIMEMLIVVFRGVEYLGEINQSVKVPGASGAHAPYVR